ncbi:tectonic-1 [Saccoglossus kowalevskii]|uniref:Tectonic-1 n=2 Tax=Saccoglossus kowalevskii TaxID=10224 RepID=A0ABM0M3G0_SACKO|nr:PREDICTED: tectonic-1 [Saccoglossus kowalevskii]
MADNKNSSVFFLIFLSYISVVFSQTGTVGPVTTATVDLNATDATTATVIVTEQPQTTEAATQLPESTELPANTDLGPCTCDLTVPSCDVNCCCDPDCSAEDRHTFSECVENTYYHDDKVCLQSYQLILANTPYTVNKTESGLFCIEFDNYEDRNYYLIPDTVYTIERFNELVDEYGDYTYERVSDTEDEYGVFYKSGDPIYTIYESLAQGVLGLPNRLTSSLCGNNNPAAYLFDESFQCTRQIFDLEAQCETMPALSAQVYYEGFKVVSTPYFLNEIEPDPVLVNSTTESPTSFTTPNATNDTTAVPTTPLYNDSTIYDHPALLPITVQNLYCIELLGVRRECNFTSEEIPRPEYDANTMTCQNAIFEVNYMFTTNGTSGISSVQVDLVFGNITSSELPFYQTYNSAYAKLEDTEIFEKSGNPGYVVGEPLMAGTMTSEVDPLGETRYSIILDSNRDNWLTMVSPTADGNCITDADSRTSVTFGLDMRTGCNLVVAYENLTDICVLIQEAVNNTLFGSSPPTHVAMFGNSRVEMAGDWVPILYDNVPASNPSPSTGPEGVCHNMVLGVHLEILYADTGSLANPQPKIIGVTYRYAQPVELKYQCIGAYCQPGTEDIQQNFEVVSSVGYIDTSSYPEGVQAAPPTFTAKLPYDFFYPFGVNAASPLRESTIFSTVVIAVVSMVLML